MQFSNRPTPRILCTKNGTIITPYEQGMAPNLERFTGHWDSVYHKRIEDSGFFVENYNGRPAFITSRHKKELLKTELPHYEIIERKIPKVADTTTFGLTDDIKLTDIQQELASQLLNSRGYSEWFINLQTGRGKTVLASYLSSELCTKTLITCFSSDILSQWVNTYRHKTTIENSRVLAVTDSKTLINIIEGDVDCNEIDIYLITHSLIASFCKKYGYHMFDELCTKIGIGLAIFDEAHRNMASMIKINALYNFKYTFYLSADYAQGDYRKEKKFYALFNHTMVLRPSEEDERSLKYTDVCIIDYDTHPSEAQKLGIRSRYGYSSQLYLDYQLNHGKLYHVLSYIVDLVHLNSGGYRMLILASHVDHVDKITEYLTEKHGKEYIIGRFHGYVSDEEKQTTLDFADIIVSTYKSFGTGRDVSKIKYVVGLNQSNKIEDNQAAGRARPLADGSNVLYFMITDRGFPYCVGKMRDRLAYLKTTKIPKDSYVFHYRGV